MFPSPSKAQAEVQRQERLYRADRPAVEIGGGTVILVDDGLATGTTIGTAALARRRQQPAWLVIAVPVAPREACYELKAVADDVICVSMRRTSSPSETGTTTFPRSPTTRCASCSGGRPPTPRRLRAPTPRHTADPFNV